MGKLTDAIEKYANEEDKPALLWLASRYSWSSQWPFVARCALERYGSLSYQVHRVWSPTNEGRLLYKHRAEIEQRAALEDEG